MEEHKVFIPCAGIGQRLTPYTNDINKALISVGNKPVISHIVDKFDKDVKFVIALGFKGDLVRQFLELTYPDRDFTFVDIDKYEGPESGLGYTILKCKKHLQCPFIFISNDTIITDEIPFWDKMIIGNWVGYSPIHAGNNYRSIRFNNKKDKLLLYDKSKYPTYPSYIGIAGINDYKLFWDEMTNDPKSISAGESYALKHMIGSGTNFTAVRFDWYDAGNKKELQRAKKDFASKDDPNILEKSDESIWFMNDKVVKYFKDETIASNRVKRANRLKGYVPNITGHTKNMYSYDYINGTTLTKAITPQNFKYFLQWINEFHSNTGIISKKDKNKYVKFYQEKTSQRLKLYFEKYNVIDSHDELINGVQLPSLSNLLTSINWQMIFKANEKEHWHGDLHFENVIVNDSGNHPPFTLLDWRQDISGDLEHGDVYYDLAKLLHGLIISHDLIDKGYYSFERNMNEVKFDFFRKNVNIECEKIFWEWSDNTGYNPYKIKIITALIFINIAGLHHYPYCHLLYYVGKTMLHNTLKDYENI